MSTFSVLTYGCKLNQADSDFLRSYFLQNGYVENKSDPELVIINTCVVTHKAERDGRHTIHKALQNKKPVGKVVITGCMASLKNLPAIQKELKQVDFAGTIEDCLSFLNIKQDFLQLFPSRRRPFLKIQEGCNLNCSYCIVPQVRGRSRSLEKKNILPTARQLVDRGYREIVITGTQIGDWGKELGFSLRELLQTILALDSEFRIRLSSILPIYVNNDLLQFIKDTKGRIVPHFHLSLQSGSDRVLRAMQRPYTLATYVRIVDKILTYFPDAAIGSDFIVGFPSETHADFAETLEVIQKIPFAYLHVFEYSQRPGTRAASLPNTVTPEERKSRVKFLLAEDAKKRESYKNRFVNKELAVLVEKEENGFYLGHSENYLMVKIPKRDGNTWLGKLVKIKITAIDSKYLLGQS